MILSPSVSRILYFPLCCFLSCNFLIGDGSWNLHEGLILAGSNVSIAPHTCLLSWLFLSEKIWTNTSVSQQHWIYILIIENILRVTFRVLRVIFRSESSRGRHEGIFPGRHQLVHLPCLARLICQIFQLETYDPSGDRDTSHRKSYLSLMIL